MKMNLFNLLSFCLLRVFYLGSATVSNSFKDCSQFFYMQTPPAGIRGSNLKWICQTYGDKQRYATLYDCSRRLPLYSAYVFKKSDGQRRVDTPWMFEPQLASDDEGSNMRVLPLSEDTPALVEDSQAVLEDYTDAVEYRRGPLNPDLHQAEPDDKSSTYTLTNVVPLTLPGIAIRRNNRDRMTAPKHLWLAYCCPWFDRNSPYEVRFMFPSYGGYALNEHVGFSVVEVPLKTLESFLRNQVDIYRDMTVFYKGCLSEKTFKKKRRDLTVTQPQPEERKNERRST